MLDYLARAFATSLRQHQAPLVLAALILTAGIVTGALRLVNLDAGQRAQVGQYLDYLAESALAGPDGAAPAGAGHGPGPAPWPAAGGNVRQVGLAWGAGCLVLGLPVTLGLLFLHGYSLGFAVGAMAAHWQWRGLLMAVAAVFPASALQLPALLLVAAGATRLAAQVAASRWRRALPTLASPWAAYFGLGLVAAVLALGAGLIEAYLAPALTALVARWVL